MSDHTLRQTEIASRFLLEFPRRISHVHAATAIADWQAVQKDVLAKLHGHLRIERLHKAVTKNVAGNHVRMARTEDQDAVGVNSRPVNRHEAALVAKRVEIVRKPVVEILPTKLAWATNHVRR